MSHRLYIETVGCQMNMLDSEMVVADLRKRGYELTSDVKIADVKVVGPAANFTKLVLFCVEADFCTQKCIFQH